MQVDEGALQGLEQETAMAYLGIPYARPPIGMDRWREPQAAVAWKGTRPADHFGFSCYQAPFKLPASMGRLPFTHEYIDVGPISEDCLYLNVWAPKHLDAGALPVLVWIHGGGFGGGSGSIPIYNGASLAQRGIVVISINYRVDVFGFLAHPELTAESPRKVSGNYGLLDIVAALRWVRKNIAAFGGDPNRVTVAGQSAGAAAVMALIQMPQAQGLFSRAIAESGPVLPIAARDMRASESLGQELASRLGATHLAAMRALSAAELLAAAHSGPPGPPRFQPSMDGQILRVDLGQPSAEKAVSDVPILTGMNANEAGPRSTLGDFMGPPVPATTVNYVAKIKRDYGAIAPDVLRLYPAQKDSETVEAAQRLARDKGIAAIIHWGNVQMRYSHSPVYTYLFNHTEPGPFSASDGPFHTSEVPYVFGTLDAAPERGFSPVDRRISETMQRYWVNFINSGNPNGAGLNDWPSFTPTDPKFMVLDSSFRAQTLMDDAKMSLFDDFLRQGGALSVL
ncbi:MAG TPA: carboxylesterase family protein [Steroidobacteraceae bacterium]|nr:carboxylesterase family protein [Steroidobacteraceae bacterium]